MSEAYDTFVLRGILHDLSNYFTIMDGTLALLRRTQDPCKREQYLDRLQQACCGARELLQRIGRDAAGSACYALHPLLQHTLALFALSGDAARVCCTLQAGRDTLQGESAQMQNVLLNLLLNADRAMQGRPGQIFVHTRNLADRLVLCIRDEGCGMGPEVLARIFEAGFSTRGSGHGMGLPLARQAVQRAGGTLCIQSTPGVGTCVTVTLPLAP